MKEGILICVFGTAEKEARQKCIYSIERHIKDVYENKNVYLAFTSRFIVKKLKGLNEDVSGVEEIFEKIRSDNVKRLYVMPVLMTKGEEYERLKERIATVKGNIITDIGSPILDTENDLDKLADILKKEYQAVNDSIIFMGHGNKNFSGTEYIRLNEKLGENMHIACVEGEPCLEKAIKSIGEKRGKRILLVPLMICAGEHIKNDMAGDWKNILTEKGFDVECIIKGLGELKAFRQLIAERIIK